MNKMEFETQIKDGFIGFQYSNDPINKKVKIIVLSEENSFVLNKNHKEKFLKLLNERKFFPIIDKSIDIFKIEKDINNDIF